MLQHPLKCCVPLTSSSFLKKSGLDLAKHGFLPAKQKRLLLIPRIGRLVLDFGTPVYDALTSLVTSFSSFQKIIISLLGSLKCTFETLMLLCVYFLFLIFWVACPEGQRKMHKEKNFQMCSFSYACIQAKNLPNSEPLPSQNLEIVKKDHFFPASQK